MDGKPHLGLHLMANQAVVQSSSELSPREGDEHLSPAELARLEIFLSLEHPLDYEKHASATVLRRFAKGDVICRQGEAGQTAFYILFSEDVLELKTRQYEDLRREFERATDTRSTLYDQIQEVKSIAAIFQPRVDAFTAEDDQRSGRQAASAHLLTGQIRQARPHGMLGRLNGKLLGARGSADVPPEFVANDGPVDINYNSKQAPICEGEMFGETSCMTGAPRSATVVADTEICVLEMTWDIYSELQRDPAFRLHVDKNYRERVLQGHLRRLPILQGLTDSDLDFIRQRVRLDIADPGDVICDENDPPDGAYIIRSGQVQVLGGLNLTLKPGDISDWQSFCKQLMAGAT